MPEQAINAIHTIEILGGGASAFGLVAAAAHKTARTLRTHWRLASAKARAAEARQAASRR